MNRRFYDTIVVYPQPKHLKPIPSHTFCMDAECDDGLSRKVPAQVSNTHCPVGDVLMIYMQYINDTVRVP